MQRNTQAWTEHVESVPSPGAGYGLKEVAGCTQTKVLWQGTEAASGNGDVGGDATLMPRWKEILYPIRKLYRGEYVSTNTPERQAAGAGIGQTTPTKP